MLTRKVFELTMMMRSSNSQMDLGEDEVWSVGNKEE